MWPHGTARIRPQPFLSLSLPFVDYYFLFFSVGSSSYHSDKMHKIYWPKNTVKLFGLCFVVRTHDFIVSSFPITLHKHWWVLITSEYLQGQSVTSVWHHENQDVSCSLLHWLASLCQIWGKYTISELKFALSVWFLNFISWIFLVWKLQPHPYFFSLYAAL